MIPVKSAPPVQQKSSAPAAASTAKKPAYQPPASVTQQYEVKPVTPTTTAKKEEPVEIPVPDVREGMIVVHKKFGEGTLRMDKAKKYLTVTFAAGEKKFVYPDVFKDGFLTVKQ